MRLTRRAFLMAGVSLALTGCGGRRDDAAEEFRKEAEELEEEAKEEEAKEEKEEVEEEKVEEVVAPEPIVAETTYYDVFRCDWREGLFGDVEAYTVNTMDFSDSYAVINPDGGLNFEISGVAYNGTVSRGKETTHLYSGQDTKVTQLLFDGRDDATVGAVLIQGYYVESDGYPLIEMITDVDGKQVFATFYLCKHVDE